MKGLIYVGSYFASLLFFSTGCQVPHGNDVKAAGIQVHNPREKIIVPAVAYFEEDVHDFGQIPQGKPVSCKFLFKNTGGYTLKIQSVEPSCGCTATQYTQEPLEPQEDGFVTAEFNAATVGSFVKTITFRSNASPSIQMLVLKGEVLPAE